MNHEIKGDMAERMLTALERIADELERANERNHQNDVAEAYARGHQR